jgi:hypothetical protein
MKKFIIITAALIMSFSGISFAAGNDATTINYSVAAINELNIDDDTLNVAVDTGVAGEQPLPDMIEGTYDLTTNCTADSKKITAQINSNMPSGTTLMLGIEAATGASSSSPNLSSTVQDCMVMIDATAQANLRFNLNLQATVSAGVISSAGKTLTLTLTDAS